MGSRLRPNAATISETRAGGGASARSTPIVEYIEAELIVRLIAE